MVIFLLRYKYKVLLFYFLLVLLLSYFFTRQHCRLAMG